MIKGNCWPSILILLCSFSLENRQLITPNDLGLEPQKAFSSQILSKSELVIFKNLSHPVWKPGSAYGYPVQHPYELYLDLHIPSRNYVSKPWNPVSPSLGPCWHPSGTHKLDASLCVREGAQSVRLPHMSPRLSQHSGSQAGFSWVILGPLSLKPAMLLLNPTPAKASPTGRSFNRHMAPHGQSTFQIALGFSFMIRMFWLEGPIDQQQKPSPNTLNNFE